MAENTADSKQLSELERRWRDEPGSRVFLQLAEEYRRTGQTEEALKVLDEGLERNPQHVAAQVARARCLLELGRTGEGVRVLDRVLEQDATHLVARKLLVEAHIQRRDALSARRQLDLYTTLAGADPEVEELRERIQGLLLTDADSPAAAELSAAAEGTTPSAPAREPAAPTGIPPESTLSETPSPESPGREPSPPVPPSRPPAEAVHLPPSGEPFPGLEREVVERGEGDGAGDVFLSAPVEPRLAAAVESPAGEPEAEKTEEGFEPPGEEEPPSGATVLTGPSGEAEPSTEVESSTEVEEEAVPEDDTLPLRPVPGAQGAGGSGGQVTAGPEAPTLGRGAFDRQGDEAVAEPGREPPATVTLGQLYLRQGHLDEAERIFRRVLERDPDNAAAREGLKRVTEEPAVGEITTAPPAPSGAPVALTERKVQLLERYLTLLRRGAERDVP